MKTIAITLEGISPLLLNRFPLDEHLGKGMAGQGRSIAVGEERSPREQCEACLYKNSAGELVIPTPNIVSAIVAGGAFFRLGKSKVTTQRSSIIPALLTLQELEVPLQHTKPWDIDARSVVNKMNNRLIKYRPIFYDWSVSVTAMLDIDMMSPKFLRDIVDAAGKRVGLGDFRVERKGPFGKFVVTRWEALD